MGLSDIHFFLIDGKTNQTSKTKASRDTINLGLIRLYLARKKA